MAPPMHTRRQFLLSTVHPDYIIPAGSKQGLTWPAIRGSLSLSDTALSATLSVAAASLPPVEWRIAVEYTQYPETSQLLSIMVRLHVVFLLCHFSLVQFQPKILRNVGKACTEI